MSPTSDLVTEASLSTGGLWEHFAALIQAGNTKAGLWFYDEANLRQQLTNIAGANYAFNFTGVYVA